MLYHSVVFYGSVFMYVGLSPGVMDLSDMGIGRTNKNFGSRIGQQHNMEES